MITLLLAAALVAPQAPDEPVPASARKRTAEDRAAYAVDFDVPPRVKKQTRPDYPLVAFTEKVEGAIEVEFVIDEQGRVRDPEVDREKNPIKGSPLAANALYQEALAVVRRWRFDPAKKDGRPIATIARAPVMFRILPPR